MKSRFTVTAFLLATLACADGADPEGAVFAPALEEVPGGMFVPNAQWGGLSATSVGVRVTGSGAYFSTFATHARNAALAWNDPLGAAGGYQFDTSNPDAAQRLTINLHLNGTANDYFCGSHGTTSISLTQVNSFNATCAGNGTIDDAYTVALHEIARVLKFNNQLFTPQTDLCALYIPAAPNNHGNMNGEICEHERQFIYHGYGLRAVAPLDTHLLVTDVFPGTSNFTVQIGQSVDVYPVFTCATTSESVSGPCESGVSWTRSNGNVTLQSLSGGGVRVTGAAAGTAVVSVQPASPSADGAVVYPRPGARGITVTVAAPPPPLAVSIGGRSEIKPKTTGCIYWAAVSGGTAPYTYSWSTSDWSGSSFGPSITEPTDYDTEVYVVGTGTFTLRLQVTDAVGAVQNASKSITSSSTATCEPAV